LACFAFILNSRFSIRNFIFLDSAFFLVTNVGGYKVILTGKTAIMSDHGGETLVGLTSALPQKWVKGIVERGLFPTRSDHEGRMKLAPYSLCKVKATLLEHGFSRDDVIIVDPRKLRRAFPRGDACCWSRGPDGLAAYNARHTASIKPIKLGQLCASRTLCRKHRHHIILQPEGRLFWDSPKGASKGVD